MPARNRMVRLLRLVFIVVGVCAAVALREDIGSYGGLLAGTVVVLLGEVVLPGPPR